MRTDWKTSKLSEVCEIKPPKREAKEILSETDLVSFVPMNDLGIRQKELSLNEEKPLGKVAGSYTYFAENDVLLAKITPCFENGKLGIARGLKNGIGFGSSEYIVFRSHGKIDPEYLFYFLSQDSFRDEGAKVMTGAVGHKRVPKEFIEDHPIHLPLLEEQKRIVAVLDEAFAGIDSAIANTEKNFANARELFESYLQQVLSQRGESWEEKPLVEITSILGDGLHGTPDYSEDGEYYFINGNNLSNGIIEFKERTKKVTVDEYHKHKKDLTDRTVLVSINGTLGNVAFYNDEKIILGKSACYFNLLDGIDKHFIKYVILSPYFLEYAHREATGATIKNVSLKSMRAFKVPLPPIKIQNGIVGKLDALSFESRKVEGIYSQKLTSLRELKQALLQKAFSGELTAEDDKLMDEAVA